MNPLFELAFEHIRQLPENDQNDFAGFIPAHPDEWVATADEAAALAQVETEIDRGDVVAGAERDAVLRRLRS